MSETASAETREHDANTTVAKNIRIQLTIADMRQVDLADALQENEMWLSRRMKGAPEFSAGDIQAIANVFGIAPGDLFTTHNTPIRGGSGDARGLRYVAPPLGLEPRTCRFKEGHIASVIPLRQAHPSDCHQHATTHETHNAVVTPIYATV